MCGITGWIDWQRNMMREKDVLREMNQSLEHRGPDERGEWFDENAAFAHRRLIVIDPDGGKQPMEKMYQGNRYILVYNGELYNTDELRDQLILLGHNFKSHSDTEVLLSSYIEWGEDCVKYLNGIFAFAVWDQKKRKLYIARDRIGVKPLFFSRKGKGIIFASEIKALLKNPLINSTINSEGLAELFVMGPNRTPGHGVFSDIDELKPGYYLVFDRNGLRKEQYWSLESKPHEDNLDTTILKLRQLFIDTVDRQLISDVPICTLLSGGLDSSAITVVAAKYLQEKKNISLHTYSVDYEGNDKYFKKNDFQPDSDNKWIKLISNTANTVHHNVKLSNQELADTLREGMLARDIPGMADIDVSLYLFCKEIKKNFTVAVSGECADEIFGGYPWFYRKDDIESENFPWARKLDFKLSIFSSDLLSEFKAKEYLKMKYQEAVDEVPVLPGEDETNARMRELFYLNLTRWMPVLLDRKDRMSMYTGLEVRVPFCDHRIVEYVWNIPWEMKNYQNMRKGIFRASLKNILPEEVRTRPKNPYPKTFNPVYLNACKEILSAILENRNAPIHDYIETKKLKDIINSAKNFDVPWFGQLMNLPQMFAYLIQLNYWLEDYKVSYK
ncbi:MAG: asparagine synthase (glutamine-hydrolyzing), partial [Halanaerobiaceae bacterium]